MSYTKTIAIPTTATEAARKAVSFSEQRGTHAWNGVYVTPTHRVYLIDHAEGWDISYCVLIRENK